MLTLEGMKVKLRIDLLRCHGKTRESWLCLGAVEGVEVRAEVWLQQISAVVLANEAEILTWLLLDLGFFNPQLFQSLVNEGGRR